MWSWYCNQQRGGNNLRWNLNLTRWWRESCDEDYYCKCVETHIGIMQPNGRAAELQPSPAAGNGHSEPGYRPKAFKREDSVEGTAAATLGFRVYLPATPL